MEPILEIVDSTERGTSGCADNSQEEE